MHRGGTLMVSIREFQFFDPEGEVTVTEGHLPHWTQSGATYFITYRTCDSISKVAMHRILRMRDEWLAHHGINASRPQWHRQLVKLSNQQQATFRRMFGIEFENELDQLSGECLLGKNGISQIVADSLHHFNGERYCLGSFVIMPNHVHLLVCVFPEFNMLDQCYGWKHFQSHEINRALSRSGHFFQSESFDHLVRDDEHFWKFRRYISDNPTKAGLREGEYVLWQPKIKS